MCGIVGFTGDKNAVPILMSGLSRLEYRGYDSSGIALFAHNNIHVLKAKGRLTELEQLIERNSTFSLSGIGHTRWATHGEPSYANAHPHMSKSGRFAVVHNGIIENYEQIRQMLAQKGYTFLSQTDTEVVAHLLEHFYEGDVLGTIIKVRAALEGSYALGILCKDNEDTIYALRKDSPLVAGVCNNGAFIASDVAAMLEHTRDFYEISENEVAVLNKQGISFFDTHKHAIKKDTFHVDWDVNAASKGGFEHFLIKEILEQPKALKDTIHPRIKNDKIVFGDFELSKQQILAFDKLFIVGCGSAMHAGIVGKNVIERLARLPCETVLASEFRYSNPLITPSSLVIIISQSGETADSLAALRYAKSKGAKTLSIVNVLGSSIAKQSDWTLFTNAGPEISVATTKAYSCQLAVLYMLAVYFAHQLESIDTQKMQQMVKELLLIPQKVEQILQDKDKILQYSRQHFEAKNVFFMGRCLDYAAALEASLKLKEISYIHSEAYAAGEMKHGTIALIEHGTLVVVLSASQSMLEKTYSNLQEVKARGAHILSITTDTTKRIEQSSDHCFYLPHIAEEFIASLSIVPLQLLAYYIASLRKLDIDKPRNLAKSVTVE